MINDGSYNMPAEYDIHSGTLMIWPVREGSWGKDSNAAKDAFCSIFKEIIKSENLYVLVNKEDVDSASKYISSYMNANMDTVSKDIALRMKTDMDSASQDLSMPMENSIGDASHNSACQKFNVNKGDYRLEIIPIETDDAWARDVGPTFVRNREGKIAGVDWCFNAWGGEVDGLYASWDKDDAVAKNFCEHLDIPVIDAHPFVLEGGSIHSDGEGTLMVTESCLLSKGRNPELSKEDIEEQLKKYLGAQKVLWLPCGIYNDETNEHVDNVCAFTAPGEVVLAWTENENDPQYEMSKRDFEYLSEVTDARGRHLKIHKLPIPDNPVCCTEADIENYVFEEGEDIREEGERLAASYVNFYFTNTEVLIPAFGGENEESDNRAAKIMSDIVKNRKVVQIDARAILLGGGNIHCITQQIPSEISNMRRKVICFE